MRTIAAVLDQGKDKHVAQSPTPSASCWQGPFSWPTGQDYPMAKRDTQHWPGSTLVEPFVDCCLHDVLQSCTLPLQLTMLGPPGCSCVKLVVEDFP